MSDHYVELLIKSKPTYLFKLIKQEVEFEYFYMDGDLDITKIINMSKRIKVQNIHASMVTVAAPVDHQEIAYYGNIETLDCSSQNPADEFFAIVFRDDGVMKKVVINKNDAMLKAMRLDMPGKVKLR